MKKVYVAKQDTAAAVINKVLKAPGDTVVLYVPRGTKFAASRNNFLLLRRETRAAGKAVTVESVDDDILELAATAGFRAANPFFGRQKRAVSDIVMVGKGAAEKIPVDVSSSGEPEREEEKTDETGAVDTYDAPKKKRPAPFLSGIKGWKERRARRKDAFGKDAPTEKRRRIPRLVLALGALILVGGVSLAALPRVTVTLNFEKTPWDFVGTLHVSPQNEESRITNDEVEIRGVSFREQRNMTEAYPASGREFVERKAKGIMTVYNAYSSEPQQLVRTTRLVSPEGVVFRTDEDITVPGAKIEEGRIIPSSTAVGVTADEAGEKANLGPVERFRIPGFQGTPKYDGFYGESGEPMTGGFVGERAVPTDDDIEKAREEIVRTLEEAAKTQLFLNLPPEVKVFEDTYRFEITDEVIDEGAGDSDTFTVTAVGEARLTGFLESELVETFGNRVIEEAGVPLIVKEYEVEYGEATLDEAGTGFRIPVTFRSVWTEPFDADAFKQETRGKKETELKTLIFSIPGVQSGEVRFWPFWVKTVPDKLSRIVVDVQ